MAALLQALEARRARRAFDPRPVPDDARESLWRAVSVAPSHGNAQSVRLLEARAPNVRAALEAALSAGNRGWASAAPLLAALGALPAHERADAYGGERAIWAFHAGIAAANLMAQATALGLIAHPMAGFDEHAARSAFAAPAGLRVLAVFAIGFPGAPETLPGDLRRRERRERRRLPLDRLVAVDRWRARHGEPARPPEDAA